MLSHFKYVTATPSCLLSWTWDQERGQIDSVAASRLLPANRLLVQARGKKKRAGKDMDMEVTFTPGLEGLGARLLAQRKEASQRKGDTVWEAYLRRQK
jgi:hypothetical protein